MQPVRSGQAFARPLRAIASRPADAFVGAGRPCANAAPECHGRSARVLLSPTLRRLVARLSCLMLLVWGLSPAWALDINQADAEQLQTLKGIGSRLAERILVERARGGFRDFDDLSSRVKGVGPARIRQWQRAGATVSPPGRPALMKEGQADQARAPAGDVPQPASGRPSAQVSGDGATRASGKRPAGQGGSTPSSPAKASVTSPASRIRHQDLPSTVDVIEGGMRSRRGR